MPKKRSVAARRARRPDYVVLFCLFALVVFGLAMLSSASSYIGKTRFNDSYYFVKHQLLNGLVLGLIGFSAGMIFRYRRYEKLALIMLIASLILVGLTFTQLGFEAKGATRWLTIGPITFQPSEFLKITFILYLAAWLGRDKERRQSFTKGFLPFFSACAIVSGILLAQHSTSVAALLMVVATVIYFMSGARVSYIIGGGAVFILILAAVIYFTPYRLNRVISFFERDANTQSSGFHLNQSLIAIGSGGLFGVGYGQSTSKVSYLPESIGDSIFAVIAEEFGFVGASLLVGLFGVLVFKVLYLAFKTSDRFAQLILIGFGSLIGLQAFINIAALSGILPLTGMPLPFISYGGTALAVFMTIGGIIVNISRYS